MMVNDTVWQKQLTRELDSKRCSDRWSGLVTMFYDWRGCSSLELSLNWVGYKSVAAGE